MYIFLYTHDICVFCPTQQKQSHITAFSFTKKKKTNDFRRFWTTRKKPSIFCQGTNLDHSYLWIEETGDPQRFHCSKTNDQTKNRGFSACLESCYPLLNIACCKNPSDVPCISVNFLLEKENFQPAMFSVGCNRKFGVWRIKLMFFRDVTQAVSQCKLSPFSFVGSNPF